MIRITFFAGILLVAVSCSNKVSESAATTQDTVTVIKPLLVSDSVTYDSDDPAFWINKDDPAQSLVIGTDKGGDTGDGALYVFDLSGKEVPGKTVKGIKRPNNVDVAYRLAVGSGVVDIAVCTERNTNSIRIFSLPDMKPLDNGGIPVFEGEADTLRLPMGIALYTAPDKDIYAIVGRKSGPTDGTYLWQYRLEAYNGIVIAKLVRKFGQYSGKNEIESIAVDNELGYVYCSDEGVGIRKYYAHPDSSGSELALFGTTGFVDNHEGISIYKRPDGTGYLLVSDQQANRFHIFPREGKAGNPHDHPLLKIVYTSTVESDGSEIISTALPGFPGGLFVAMSDDKTFQFYSAEDLIGAGTNPDR